MRTTVVPLFVTAVWLMVASVSAVYGEADCAQGTPGESSRTSLWLPSDALFRPPLADVKEPRFYAEYRRVDFGSRGAPGGEAEETINSGIVGLGDTFGLWSRRTPGTCNGIQIGVFGGVFSQFNLDAPSSDLLNSDFVVGMPVSFRYGFASGRVRLFHQSSHLGDEFLLQNPDFDRQNLSFEAVDGLGAVDVGFGRVYGGGGYLFSTTPDLDPKMLQWGAELWLPTSWTARAGSWDFLVAPVFGVDFKTFEEQDWDVTTSLEGGFEFLRPGGTQRVRILGLYLDGFSPYGQFFNTEEIESYGIGIQFEL